MKERGREFGQQQKESGKQFSKLQTPERGTLLCLVVCRVRDGESGGICLSRGGVVLFPFRVQVREMECSGAYEVNENRSLLQL